MKMESTRPERVRSDYPDGISLPPWNGRAIMLVDLDAFFASVEQLDHPSWRGKPVIVGGDPDKRGVVSTASYEARKFGVHSAMPSSTARRLCPQAIWTSGHYSRYKEMSDRVMRILLDESPFMQQVSVDEAFLDVTPTAHIPEHPVLIAQRIKARVAELGITCSIGLGVSKSVAKIASDADKPDGLTVVFPGREADYLAPLPIRTMSGIGEAAERKLASFGLKTLGDIAHASDSMLANVFGKNAHMMRMRCLGADESPVVQDDEVKSVSNEMSFATSLSSRQEIERALATMTAKVCRRLRKKSLKATTFALKIRYEDLKIRTAQLRMDSPADDEYLVTAALEGLIDQVWTPGMLVRLVGVAASGFGGEGEVVQGRLFDMPATDGSTRQPEPAIDDARRSGLIAATDKIRDRFGERAVNFGRENATLGSTTGSGAKNPQDYKS
ncbi:MAG: DNA polymerase IV [Coriobacteriaceae bacterium]|nr:DNA polymerase IV [Coriobacteriaceae bacterium]